MTSPRTSRTARFAALPLAVALSLTGCTVVTAPGNGMPGMDHGSSPSPGAGDMAKDVIDDGSDPQVQQLAQTIVESQTAEIEQMEQMLAAM
jgi:hypothetical protein